MVEGVGNSVSRAWNFVAASGFSESHVKARLAQSASVLEKLGQPNAIGRYSADQIAAAGGAAALPRLRCDRFLDRAAVGGGALFAGGIAALALGVPAGAALVVTGALAGWGALLLRHAEPGSLRIRAEAEPTGALRIRAPEVDGLGDLRIRGRGKDAA